MALSNGNYVVASPSWDNGSAMEAGAVTWGDGNLGRIGAVSPSNSLVGERLGDQVGGRITALRNGNYVVLSPGWDNGATVNVGAATWGDGAKGVTGVIAATNSLIGATANELIGNGGAVALSNGHYVVSSPFWRNGSIPYAGAATWGNGTTGTVGLVATSNSLVGTHENDYVGERLVALSNGHYVVNSPSWDNGAVVNAGASTPTLMMRLAQRRKRCCKAWPALRIVVLRLVRNACLLSKQRRRRPTTAPVLACWRCVTATMW